LDLQTTSLVRQLHLPAPKELRSKHQNKKVNILELILVSITIKIHSATGAAFPFDWDVSSGAQPNVNMTIATNKLAPMVFRQPAHTLNRKDCSASPTFANFASVRQLSPEDLIDW
jgi:hypothetical protein